MLIAKGDEVVLSAHGRTFRPDDMLPEGVLAKNVPGIKQYDLYHRFVTSPRRNSRGQQYRPYHLVTVGLRVPTDLKRQLKKNAQEAGMSLCRYTAKVIADAVGYTNPHWEPKHRK